MFTLAQCFDARCIFVAALRVSFERTRRPEISINRKSNPANTVTPSLPRPTVPSRAASFVPRNFPLGSAATRWVLKNARKKSSADCMMLARKRTLRRFISDEADEEQTKNRTRVRLSFTSATAAGIGRCNYTTSSRHLFAIRLFVKLLIITITNKRLSIVHSLNVSPTRRE
jgi:hypothetical protein